MAVPRADSRSQRFFTFLSPSLPRASSVGAGRRGDFEKGNPYTLELTAAAAAEIDQAMAATAWEQALRDSYVSQQVYIIMFLVLESRTYREILLVHERPRIQA